MNTCTAHSKGTGERCKLPPSPGRTVCRFHGGRTPRGVDSPHYKGGRYPKAFRGDLLTRYTDLVSDSDLLSTREEIAAYIMRIDDLLVTARTMGEAAELLAAGPRDKASKSKLSAAIAAEDRAWSRIDRALNTLAKLREVELKRLEKLRAFISLDQAQALMRMLALSVQQQIASGKTGQVLIDAIHRDITATIPTLPGGTLGD